jgi:membrane protease YdiL (CAAX protease family)
MFTKLSDTSQAAFFSGLVLIMATGVALAIRIFELTPILPVGNKLISLPLFYGTVVAASFVYGYLRLYTGGVWPASLAHAVHNAAWGVLGAFTATSYPVIVNKYLVGDFGALILVGAVIGAIWLNRRLMRSGPDGPRPRVTSGRAPAV